MLARHGVPPDADADLLLAAIAARRSPRFRMLATRLREDPVPGCSLHDHRRASGRTPGATGRSHGGGP